MHTWLVTRFSLKARRSHSEMLAREVDQMQRKLGSAIDEAVAHYLVKQRKSAAGMQSNCL